MSFKKLEEAQQKALSKTLYTKDGDEYDAPDLAAFIKAEELKGKIIYLDIDTMINGDILYYALKQTEKKT